MNRILTLIEKYRKNECSKEELEELLDYFAVNGQEANLKQAIQTSFEELMDTDDETHAEADELFPLIKSKINASAPRKRLVPVYSWLAAAALLLGVAIVAYLIIPQHKTSKSTQAAAVITPGSRKAILTLANGSTITLNSAPNGKLAQQGATVVTKTANGQLVYNAVSGYATTVNELNRISTPPGGTYDLVLSDGTHVWLNAASTLSYPVNFDHNERRVELTGEAYFEVAHMHTPFKVVSRHQTVQVLGTHFNIEAYEDEVIAKTTLLQGSVKLLREQAETFLKPGQTAINDLKGNLRIEPADEEQVMAWKNGLFVFNNETIGAVMRKAARWYNIDVVYQDNVSSKKLWGAVSRYKNITELLDNLVIAGKLKYKIEGRRVILMK